MAEGPTRIVMHIVSSTVQRYTVGQVLSCALHVLGEARKVVVDGRLDALGARVLRKPHIRTDRAMHSRKVLVTSAHSAWERRSLELAQHASTAANSAAHGALDASFFGRTLSWSTFMAERQLVRPAQRRPHVTHGASAATAPAPPLVDSPPRWYVSPTYAVRQEHTQAPDAGTTSRACESQLFCDAVRCYANPSRKAALAEKSKPHSTREAGAGGSSNTMLRLYTDDSKGLTVYVP